MDRSRETVHDLGNPVISSLINPKDNYSSDLLASAIANSPGGAVKLLRASVEGPVKDAWISGWVGVYDSDIQTGMGQFGPNIGVSGGGGTLTVEPGQGCRHDSDFSLLFIWGGSEQGSPSSMIADLGQGVSFAFPAAHLEVWVIYNNSVNGSSPPFPDTNTHVNGGLSIGLRPSPMRLTKSYVTSSVNNGSNSTIMPVPPYAKSVAVYAANGGAFSVTLSLIPAPGDTSADVTFAFPATTGQTALALDLPGTVHRIQISNTSASPSRYALVYGLSV